MSRIDSPFSDLPHALVADMLSKCDSISTGLSESFQIVCDNKVRMRNKLIDHNLLRKDSEFETFSMNPTSCGIDGSYAIERLLSTDIAAAAALAIEGLTPPNEKRRWDKPYHLLSIPSVHASLGMKLLIHEFP